MMSDDLKKEQVSVSAKPLNKKSKTNHGSLVINKSSIDILMNNNATAKEICAFLTLSCFTNKEYGKYNSNASYNAVMNRLGVGKNCANILIDDLSHMEYKGYNLVELPDSNITIHENGKVSNLAFDIDYMSDLRANLILNKSKHSLLRWRLSCKSNKEIWIHKDLVGKGRSLNRPLNVLWRLCGDVATRLYLVLFYYNALDITAVSPHVLGYSYDTSIAYSLNNIDILKAIQTDKAPYISDTLINTVFTKGIYASIDGHNSYTSELKSALKVLEYQGFIYRSVYVFISEKDSGNIINYYELDCKINNKRKYKSELFCNHIRELACELGLKSIRDDGRFYRDYIAIAPSNMRVSVVMVYRLKYGVINPNNYRVDKVFTQRREYNLQVHEWIAGARQGVFGSWGVER